jgi:hypothetical protein
MMIIKQIALGLFLPVLLVCNNQVQIQNRLNEPVVVELQIPGKTEANIQFKNLENKQQLLQQELAKAVLRDSADDIKHLVSEGADVNHVYDFIKVRGLDKPGMPAGSGAVSHSVLSLAIKFKKHTAIRTLLQLNANITEDDLLFLMNVDSDQRWSILKLVPNLAVCAKSALKSMLYRQSKDEDSIAAIIACMNAGCNVDELWSYIVESNIKLQPKVLEFMLKHGADPNKIVYYAGNGKPVTDYHWRPLHVYLGNMTVYTGCCSCGCATKNSDCDNRVRDIIDAINLLVAYGADLTLPIQNGYGTQLYPLEFVVTNGFSEIVLCLLEHGATR